ncbi:MAG: transcriptional regulator [Spirochaetaceae bacterium]|nr:transcriptional regulator [Spirochaetaceae bacterium]
MEELTQNSEELKLSTISSLIDQIHTEATYFLDCKLKAEGLSKLASSHGFIIFTLSQNKDEETLELKPLTMKEITRIIDKDKSTTTVLIEKLRKLGYVQKEKATGDTRFCLISLTEKGKSYTKQMEQISKILTEKFYAGFSEDEKKTVFTLLKKIQSNFDL